MNFLKTFEEIGQILKSAPKIWDGKVSILEKTNEELIHRIGI